MKLTLKLLTLDSGKAYFGTRVSVRGDALPSDMDHLYRQGRFEFRLHRDDWEAASSPTSLELELELEAGG